MTHKRSFIDWVLRRNYEPVADDEPTEDEQIERSIWDAMAGIQTKDDSLALSRSLDERIRTILAPPAFSTPDGQAMDSAHGQVVATMDSAGVGGAYGVGQQRMPEVLLSWYVQQSFIGYQSCGFLAQHWLVDKACSMKGRDAVRHGFNLAFDEGEDVTEDERSYIEKRDSFYDIKGNLERADKFKNVFGIRHVLFVVDSDDPDYYRKPFNAKGIKPGAYRGMSQIDPYWLAPLLDAEDVGDPASMTFYDPEFWIIAGTTYHRSHFVIMRGSEVSDIQKPSYIYGGIPLTQQIYERVYAAERTANEAPLLVQTKRMTVHEMDLASIAANPEAAQKTLEAMASFRNNHSIIAKNKGEKVEQLETSLADLDPVMMGQYQLVSAVCRVPAVKLLGTTPRGFNATGDHETSTYHEELETIQANDLSEIVTRHHECVSYSDFKPKYKKELLIEHIWNPVCVTTDTERAEINNKNADTDSKLYEMGAVSDMEVRDRLIADDYSGHSGIEAFDEGEFSDNESGEAGNPDVAGKGSNPSPDNHGSEI
ncbi:MAG: DUF1073 domain-containing protein [Gammaproteobacteria bacterium]|nr:DUF1073 domain-containing protein [Gammaproteobacteria bacterium]